MNLSAILSVDLSFGIGKNNRLLNRNSEDMRRFKQLTEGGVVIMGRKTLNSLPNGRPLPNRVNVVLSQTLELTDYTDENNRYIVVRDTNELRWMLNNHPLCIGKQHYVIGGGSIYSQLLPLCNTIYLTQFNRNYGADAFVDKGLIFSKGCEVQKIGEDGYGLFDCESEIVEFFKIKK